METTEQNELIDNNCAILLNKNQKNSNKCHTITTTTQNQRQQHQEEEQQQQSIAASRINKHETAELKNIENCQQQQQTMAAAANQLTADDHDDDNIHHSIGIISNNNNNIGRRQRQQLNTNDIDNILKTGISDGRCDLSASCSVATTTPSTSTTASRAKATTSTITPRKTTMENDLVADLCIPLENGIGGGGRSGSVGVGGNSSDGGGSDNGSSDDGFGGKHKRIIDTSLDITNNSSIVIGGSNNYGIIGNGSNDLLTYTMSVAPAPQTTSTTSTSSFSFKHFLSGSGNAGGSGTLVGNMSPIATVNTVEMNQCYSLTTNAIGNASSLSASLAAASPYNSPNITAGTNLHNATTTTNIEGTGLCLASITTTSSSSSPSSSTSTLSYPFQTSTGARPKIPQQQHGTSIAALSTATFGIGGAAGSGGGAGSSGAGTAIIEQPTTSATATKMKRSPRFSSFDSQASLTENSGVNNIYSSVTTSLSSSNCGIGGQTSMPTNVGRIGGGGSGGFRLHNDYNHHDNNDILAGRRLPSTTSIHTTMETTTQHFGNTTKDFERSHHHHHQHHRQHVPRSYSNYDMPMPMSMPMQMQTNTPRRRVGVVTNACGVSGGSGAGCSGATTKESQRPTRLALGISSTTAAKLKLDLPLPLIGDAVNNCSNNYSIIGGASVGIATNRLLMNTDFLTQQQQKPAAPPQPQPQPLATASALPDFVQDHWMDSWYTHESPLNSQPSSPIHDEFCDSDLQIRCGPENCGSGGGAGVGQANSRAPGCNNSNITGASSLSHNNNVAGNNHNIAGGSGGVGGGNNNASIDQQQQSVSSKMLPDFLSDGPIIHSSQRLADVAVGLPSNKIGSPDDDDGVDQQMAKTKFARLRMENERLNAELNQLREALQVQTWRADELEKQLDQQRSRHSRDSDRESAGCVVLGDGCTTMEAAYQIKNLTGGAATSTTAQQQQKQNHVTKLKQQVTLLNAELEKLRRSNDALREEGAVGGTNCDHSRFHGEHSRFHGECKTASVTTEKNTNNCNARRRSGANAATYINAMGSSSSGGGGNVEFPTDTVSGGAVGGGSIIDISVLNEIPKESSSSSTSNNAGAAEINVDAVAGGGATNIRVVPRSCKPQQISCELRRAAFNAENNLKQLLAGVENLRQMAADIESSDFHTDRNTSPDLYSEFLDDNFSEYQGGGPAP